MTREELDALVQRILNYFESGNKNPDDLRIMIEGALNKGERNANRLE